MRIDPSFQYLGNTGTDSVGNAKNQPKVASPASENASEVESNGVDAGDSVQLSGTLSEAQQLKAQINQQPDVRSSRVAALQQQLQQGTYKPSNEQIANAMMSELFGTGNQG